MIMIDYSGIASEEEAADAASRIFEETRPRPECPAFPRCNLTHMLNLGVSERLWVEIEPVSRANMGPHDVRVLLGTLGPAYSRQPIPMDEALIRDVIAQLQMALDVIVDVKTWQYARRAYMDAMDLWRDAHGRARWQAVQAWREAHTVPAKSPHER